MTITALRATPRALFLALALILAIAVLSNNTGVVRADGPPHDAGRSGRCDGRPERIPPTQAEIEAGRRKEDLARRYHQAKTASEDRSSLMAEVRLLAGVAPDEVTIKSIAVYLYPSWQEQETSYYCGPASAWVVNNWNGDHFFAGRKTSYNEGWSLTQDNLASSTYLNTSVSGTAFSSTLWDNALDVWFAGTSWWYSLKWSPDYSYYVDALTLDIDTNHPFVADVHMSPANGYLPGYSSGYWAHYVAIRGYGSYGATTAYVDTYDTGAGSLGFHSGFSSQSMVTLVQARGIIW